MRPIKLTISGLQSYREPQTVDFQTLTEAGVFGIFGPTGSGKSSILDAMTLALYGTVERASSGTHGIMNQAEQQLAVSFEFELASAKGRERYRVERTYKRKNEISIEQKISRMVRVALGDEEDAVLADKAGEVTQSVQKLLGLSMTDFTRAVVLPQGKFAEFLSLTGKDRRLMLQRLFHLEHYGDLLYQKISKRYKNNEALLKELEAEQAGLGHASEEEVREREAALTSQRTATAVRRTLFHKAESEEQEARRLWEHSEEKRRLTIRKQAHLEQVERIGVMERALERSLQAEQLRALLAEKEAAGQIRGLAAAESEAAVRRKEASAEQTAAAGQRHAAARAALEAGEAPAIARLARLRDARELQSEIARLLAERTRLQQRLQAERGELKAALEQAAREEELLAKAQQRQQELRTQLAAVEIGAEQRKRASQAARLEQQLTAAQESRAELLEQIRSRKQRHSTLAAAESECQQLTAALLDKLHAADAALRELDAAGEGLLQLAQQAAEQLPAQIDAQRRLLQEQELQQLASRLAHALQDGAPCPVCGSAEHPAPAHGTAGEDAAAPSPLQQLEQQLREAHAALQRLESDRHRLQALQRTVAAELGQAAASPEAAAAREAAAAAEALRLPEAASPAQLAAALAQLTAERQKLVGAIEQAERQLAETVQQLHASQRKHSSAQAEAQAEAAFLLELDRKLQETNAKAESLLQEWTSTFPEWKPGEAAEQQRRIEAADEQAADVKERLKKSETFIAERAEAGEQLRKRSAALDKQLAQTETEETGLGKLILEKQTRLTEWIGGEDANQLIEETEAQLKQLREEEQHSRAAHETARTALEEASSAASAAQQKLAHAEETDAKASGRWQEALQSSSFTSESEVHAALLAADRKQQMEASITAYREEGQTIAAQEARVDQLLQGRSMDEAQWKLVQQQLAEAKQAYEEAIEQMARAERDYEDIREKHLRWKELERKKEGIQAEYSRLQQLLSVFRGNAFVEYMAEEQLMAVSRTASERLRGLTRGRYAIEMDSSGGFVIRDDANGGVRRPVSTLSGGETFLTSLALALALSAQIQLSGKYPLEFFFLDEGFGTLDPDLLETVVSSLEKLHVDRLTVGVISHVPELRARLPRKLVVEPAEPWGRGSRVRLETL
ncbi:AAA family ATPase [Paenibacillus turpanensis]|uniref:AAA family ATPase n=1 Tax=Paenibacillus turpanensis TaxID=2689078 RepID=UPI00140BEEE7|nr:SMC family ATPase [Paenibacillus turpanensis]